MYILIRSKIKEQKRKIRSKKEQKGIGVKNEIKMEYNKGAKNGVK